MKRAVAQTEPIATLLPTWQEITKGAKARAAHRAIGRARASDGDPPGVRCPCCGVSKWVAGLGGAKGVLFGAARIGEAGFLLDLFFNGDPAESNGAAPDFEKHLFTSVGCL